jgi:ketosteroid isomerase-like protein
MEHTPDGPAEVARALTRAFNAKNLSRHAALWHEDARYLSPLVGCLEGRAAIAAHIHDLFERLPSEEMSVTSMSVERSSPGGGRVVLEVESSGLGPDGTSYVLPFTETLDVIEGLVVEARIDLDPAVVAQVLGHG